MPQWDFLNFLSSRARNFPSFDLRMEHEAVDLIREGERITGVLVRTLPRLGTNYGQTSGGCL